MNVVKSDGEKTCGCGGGGCMPHVNVNGVLHNVIYCCQGALLTQSLVTCYFAHRKIQTIHSQIHMVP
jgi:hypothetical protein